MDVFINHAINIVDTDTGSDIDKCFEIDLKNISNSNTQADDFVVNFSTLDFDRISTLLKSNEKLLKDLFKFSLYQTLLEETQYKIFETFAVDYKYLQNVLLYCFDKEDLNLLDIVMQKNKEAIMEPELITLFNNLLNNDIDSYKYNGSEKDLKSVFLRKLFNIQVYIGY
jgi:hypothetical protein